MPQRNILCKLEFRLLFTKRGRSNVKHSLVLVSFREFVNFFLPAVIYRLNLVRTFPELNKGILT